MDGSRRRTRTDARSSRTRASLLTIASAAMLAFTWSSGPVSAQAETPPFTSEWDERKAAELEQFFSSFECPTLDGSIFDSIEYTTTVGSQGRLPDGTDIEMLSVTDVGLLTCNYTDTETSRQRSFQVQFNLDGTSSRTHCDVEPDDTSISRIELGNVTPNYSISAQISSPGAPEAVVNQLEQHARDTAKLLRPYARGCPAEPIAVTCPAIAGYTNDEADIRMSAGAADTYSADCYYQPEDTEARPRVIITFQVTWVPERATSQARLASLCAAETTFDRGWGTVGGGGLAIDAIYGIDSDTPIDPAPLQAAVNDVIGQVAEQAQSCEGVDFVPRSQQFTPLPAPYAAAFAPEFVGGDSPPLASEINPDQQVAVVPAPAPSSPSSPDDTSAPADGSITTAPVATPEPPVDAQPAAVPPASSSSDASSGGVSGWPAVVLTILTIVLLVVSLIGLALAFLLIRSETRVRPRIDLARLVIVLISATAMMLIFSKGAPLWAVGIAVLAGLALGYAQGSHLAVRFTERGPMAKRTAWAIAAFAASLVLTQIAGLLNRTGAIAIGIALSFLSAALTAGLIVGRRPRLIEARAATAAAVIVLLIVAPFGPEALDTDHVGAQDDGLPGSEDDLDIAAVPPSAHTTAHNTLIDAVAWDQAEVTGGLWWQQGKPFTSAPVPRALNGVPEPITRTVEWTSRGWNGADPDSYSVTETFEFRVRADGWCCSIDYTGRGTRTPADGEPETWDVAGTLDDIQSVMIEGSGPFNPSNFGGQPFTEVIEFDAPADAEQPTVCQRLVGVTRNSRMLESSGGTADLTIKVDGVEQASGINPVLAFGVPCDLPGLSMQSALDAAPPPPARDDPDREGCPVLQETVAALQADTTLEGFDTATLTDVVLTPNSPTCGYGALIAMPAIGQGGKGNTRFEFAIDIAEPRQGEWDLGYERWGGRDNQVYAKGPSDVPERERCQFQPDGTLIEPEPGRTCQAFSLHQVELPGPTGFRQADDNLGWLQIFIDYNLYDGPDASFYAAFPWGAYYVRCHHCSPFDPEIVDFMTRLNDFNSQGWGGFGPAPAAPSGGAGEPAPDPGEAVETGSDDELTDEADAAVVPDVDPEVEAELEDELAEALADDDDQTRQTAAVAIMGALAAAGLLGTSLAETGMSVPELVEAWRRGGRSGVAAAAAEHTAGKPPPAPVNPDGPGEDGMYDWGGRRVSPEDYEDLLAEEQAIEADRQARIDAIIAMQNSDTAAENRFDGLDARSAEEDRLAREALADELETIRNQTRTRERVADILEERARAGGWDTIAERITRGDDLSREELISIRTSLDRLSEQQGTVDHDETGSFETDLLDEFVQDAATAQEALARIAEHTPAGPAGAWIIRNPGTAGRIGVAFATGGLSEGIIAPYEIAAAMERAAARAHAEGRDLTYGEAIAAGAWQAGPGMLIGKVGQVGIDKFGRAIADVTEEGLEAAGRQMGEFLEGGARAGAREGLEAGAREGVEAGLRESTEAGVREGAETAASRAATTAPKPPRLSPQELSDLRTQVADAVKSGDDEAMRAIYQNNGMQRLGQLEAAGAMDRQTANALVDFHDRVTGNAIRQGTRDTIDEFAKLNGGIRPTEVLVGNSGSVGAARSVVTDADRTLSTSFTTNDIDRWIVSRGGGINRTDAARQMREAFTSLHEGNVARNLNPTGTTNAVTAADMDISSYSGFRGGTSHSDLYPTGYTQARMATQGSTEVFTVSPSTGQARVHSTSGQAILDHNVLEDIRFTGKEIPLADGWPIDPRHISDMELAPLLKNQRDAIAHYTDVKSVAKAVSRAEYIAARSGQPMADPDLVAAATRMRGDPLETAAVLKELNMSEAEFVAASRQMMDGYTPNLPRPD